MDDGLALAGPDDAEALAAVHAEAFAAPWSADDLAALLGQAGVFGVAGTDGFILCRAVVDEAEILTLAVRPAARRAGRARRLVEAAAGLAATAGAARLFLEVAEDNAAARGLYAGLGFGEIGRRRGYYARADGPAVDALILARNLPDRLPSG